MHVPSPMSRLIGALVFAVCSSLLSWFWLVPAVISQSTFAALAVFLLGGTAVALLTWRNAQATGSTAQLLYETEGAAEAPRRA